MKVLTWHVHGNYLYYLSQAAVDIYLPVKPDGPHPYGGRGATFPFGDNVHDVPVEAVREMDFDCILFQSERNYLVDQYEVLSPEQRCLPRIYLEHDPPRAHPTDTRHPVDDPNVLMVHVTAFNRLMWDNAAVPTRVIEHGVCVSAGVRYSGEVPRGLVAVNNLAGRGRRLGLDIFEGMRERVPLDLVGMGSEELGGLGEIAPPLFPDFASRYRFFFHPIRYTSLGLALCEAMMIGMPIIGLATTELSNVIKNGETGYIETDPDRLVPRMRELIEDEAEARRLGANARSLAEQRFGIERFTRDWLDAFESVTSRQGTCQPSEVFR